VHYENLRHCDVSFIRCFFVFQASATVQMKRAVVNTTEFGCYYYRLLLFLFFSCVFVCLFVVVMLWCLSGGKTGDYQNCYVLYCVLKLCTVISTLRWAVLTVLWFGFCLTGPISLCVDLFAFVCVFVFFVSYCIVVVSLWAWWGGPDWIEAWSFGPIFLQCFDTVGWVIWPIKTRPRYDL